MCNSGALEKYHGVSAVFLSSGLVSLVLESSVTSLVVLEYCVTSLGFLCHESCVLESCLQVLV